MKVKETYTSEYLEEILAKEELLKDDITYLLSLAEPEEIQLLLNKADQVRQLYCGDEVQLRGIIEISNFCSENCLYCGLRKGNKLLPRYRMSVEEVLITATQIINSGIRTIVLQSGEDDQITRDQISYIIEEIKKLGDTAVTLSLGERNFDDYQAWREAGADRYLLKHETANPVLYSVYHTKEKLQERISHLKFLKQIGYQTGSGNIVGLPGQTYSDIADDIFLCKELEVDMASFSPYVSSPDTPYRNIKTCSTEYILKVIAAARIVLKDVHMPATTALGTIDTEGREKGLRAGANVIMPNFTPNPHRQKYLIYPDKKCLIDDPSFCVSCLQIMFASVGRKASFGRGDSIKLTL
jgi:biotin synthase